MEQTQVCGDKHLARMIQSGGKPERLSDDDEEERRREGVGGKNATEFLSCAAGHSLSQEGIPSPERRELSHCSYVSFHISFDVSHPMTGQTTPHTTPETGFQVANIYSLLLTPMYLLRKEPLITFSSSLPFDGSKSCLLIFRIYFCIEFLFVGVQRAFSSSL